ncbi:MAG TPA: ROK family protein [Candidatus Bathyarchaeia archaeon]|nr:ROK family protein [Candidatus Bathyarchaeia archaeon]
MTDRSPSRHLGLDLGGTNIKWVVLDRDGEAWRAIDREQVPTPARNDPDAVVGRLASLGSEVVERHPAIATVGIGVPGLYDPVAGTVRFLVNFPGAWAGRPIAREVGAALGLPVALLNDARAFGLAEHRLGAGRGVSTMVGLTLGTGVGGCVVVDGRLLLNHDGAVGEIGHQTIEPDGPWCNCGNRGCLEAFARADQVAAACGTATAEEAVERARAGDARAIEGLAELGRYLGIGIGNTVAILAPDRVVIGGGVGAATDLLRGSIEAELRRRVRITSLDLVEIVPAELGTWAGAIGAAIHGAEATADAGAAGGTPAATATAAGGRP